MKLTLAIVAALAVGLPAWAGASTTHNQAQNAPARTATPGAQHQAPPRPAPSHGSRRMGGGMGMMMMSRTRRMGPRGWVRGGPLQVFSRLLAALDNPRVRTRLELTDQQVDSLRKLIVGTETYTITNGAGIVVDAVEERELLRADQPDKTAVMAKGAAISKSMSLLIDHYLDAILSAKAILTPAQQRMIREYIEGMGSRMAFPVPRR